MLVSLYICFEKYTYENTCIHTHTHTTEAIEHAYNYFFRLYEFFFQVMDSQEMMPQMMMVRKWYISLNDCGINNGRKCILKFINQREPITLWGNPLINLFLGMEKGKRIYSLLFPLILFSDFQSIFICDEKHLP